MIVVFFQTSENIFVTEFEFKGIKNYFEIMNFTFKFLITSET